MNKKVLNDKKPIIWIVLAFILICIIILVWFMTKPIKKTESKERVVKERTTKVLEDTTEPVQEKEFWKDGNTFTAELTRYDGEEAVTKPCRGIIKEKSANEFQITIRCDYNDYFDHLDLGTFIVEGDKIKRNDMAISFEKSVEDKNPNQEGWHCTVKVSENLVEYQAFNDQVETGYYEHINFRTNHVMESFESGYGAESDLIRIRNICLTDEAQNVVE